MPTQIRINQHVNDFELISMSWGDLNLIIMSLITTKRVLEQRQIDDPTNPSTSGQIDSIERILLEIKRQYPGWNAHGISLLDNSLSETLTDKGIRKNRITII